jgi:hypothetical protein
VPLSRCVECGYVPKQLAPMDPDTPCDPYPGAYMICFKCGKIQIFGDDLEPRELTQQEAEAAFLSPDILAARLVIGVAREYAEYCRKNFNGNPSPYARELFLRQRLREMTE